MTEARHTKGPWNICAIRPNAVVTDIGAIVAVVDFEGVVDDETAEADALLIAAAPELLAALEAVRDECMGFVPKCADRVNYAIAKATTPSS